MKTIGLLGGMSWESTGLYYRAINETVRERLGGFHSAKIALYGVDFDEVEQMQCEGRWDAAGELLADAARRRRGRRGPLQRTSGPLQRASGLIPEEVSGGDKPRRSLCS